MKHLLIIGARGWGREVYAAAIGTKAYRDGEFDVKGFLDSKADAFEGLKGNYPPIICAPEDYEIQPDDVFFVAMGEPKWRRYYAEMMEVKGAEFMSIISDGAYVNPTAIIDDGCFVPQWCVVSDNVQLGKHVMLHAFTTISHDVIIKEYASVESYCFLGGGASVGKETVLHVRSHVLPRKRIGDRSAVGASSVVIRNVADDMHVAGNPAKKIEF